MMRSSAPNANRPITKAEAASVPGPASAWKPASRTSSMVSAGALKPRIVSALAVPGATSNTITSRPAPPTSVSRPNPPTSTSSPLPPSSQSAPPSPLSVSAPSRPYRLLAPALPTITLFKALPVPMYASGPFSSRFSTFAGRIQASAEEITRSVPPPGASTTKSRRLLTK
ncbi:hypothetical protein EEB15_27680 [Ramlibacter sp. WS9]|nr:hypothetical protein EEB15_27680 [Ramlibacter sp. WS9]